MNRIFTIIVICLLLLIGCQKENITGITNFQFEVMATLPSELDEGSGIEITDNTLWSFNDNSGKERLYQFDHEGRLLKELKIDVQKTDWEDIAQDESGNLYLGEFGNNDNDRRDLKIYKLSADNLTATSKVKPATINFSLEDQTQFPPADDQQHFDIEGMFALDNHLYLLTKDRSKPFVGKTKLYQLSNQAGTHTAILLDEFKTDSKKARGAITAADISPSKNKIALLSNRAIWVFTNFSGTAFFNGEVSRFNLPVERQMEGLVFSDDCTLLLINEGKSNQTGELYQVSICN